MKDLTKICLIWFWTFAAATLAILALICSQAHGAESRAVWRTNYIGYSVQLTTNVDNRIVWREATNSVESIAIVSTITNWTGVVTQGRELGYVTTNHDLRVCYQGTTNVIQAKRELSSVAVWREEVKHVSLTNQSGGRFTVFTNSSPYTLELR